MRTYKHKWCSEITCHEQTFPSVPRKNEIKNKLQN